MFLSSKSQLWTKTRLVRGSSLNFLANLFRKYWLESDNPEKLIDLLISKFFTNVSLKILMIFYAILKKISPTKQIFLIIMIFYSNIVFISWMKNY